MLDYRSLELASKHALLPPELPSSEELRSIVHHLRVLLCMASSLHQARACQCQSFYPSGSLIRGANKPGRYAPSTNYLPKITRTRREAIIVTVFRTRFGFRSHGLDSRAADEEWPVGIAFSFPAAATSSTILLGWNTKYEQHRNGTSRPRPDSFQTGGQGYLSPLQIRER